MRLDAAAFFSKTMSKPCENLAKQVAKMDYLAGILYQSLSDDSYDHKNKSGPGLVNLIVVYSRYLVNTRMLIVIECEGLLKLENLLDINSQCILDILEYKTDMTILLNLNISNSTILEYLVFLKYKQSLPVRCL